MNKSSLLLLSVICMAVYIQAATNPTFDEYIAQYGKKYSTSEYTTRKNIYDTKVAALVAQGTLYNMTAAVNNYTDWNDNELSCKNYIYIFSAPRLQNKIKCLRHNPLPKLQ